MSKKNALGTDPLSWMAEPSIAESDSTSSERDEIILENRVTLGNLQALLGQLQEAGPVTVINAERLELIDTAGVQMLVAFAHQSERLKRTLLWQNVPEILTEQASLLGFEATFTKQATDCTQS